MDRKIRRRDFLKISSVAVLGAVAAACGANPTAAPAPTSAPAAVPTDTPAPAPKATAAPVTTYTDPPMLADLVKSGKLPPVDQRLPVNPVVVSGRDAVGVFGGEVRHKHFDPVWFTSNYDWNAERMLHYSDADNKTIVPNILESWEVTPDGKTYTIKMRKGMKWSDGSPLTTEDVRFFWEDMQLDKDLNASPSSWQWRFGGSNAKFEFLDDYTFKITFAATFGNFPAHLTRFEVGNNLIFPAKWLKQYHKKYADPAKLDAAVAAAKLKDWVALFGSLTGWGMSTWQGPDAVDKNFPVISPWHIVDHPKEGLYLWERNPYYWKIDIKGNQLPYFDTMRYDYVIDDEATKLKIAQSELDIVGQHDVTMANYPFYKDNEAKANYTVGDYLSCMGDRYVIFPQFFLADDPVLTKILDDPRFVQALSTAIDRDEVNQSLFYGTDKPGQMCPMPESKYYKEKYGTAWATFDKAKANSLLDAMGLDKKNDQGIRLRPDGKPLQYMIEHAGVRVGPVTGKLTEMIVNYWREIGIDASTKEIQESLYNERMNNAQVQCGVWHADRCTDMLLHIEMNWYIPIAGGQGGASSKWSSWYNAADKKATGLVEPPDKIKNLYNLFDQMTSVVDENQRVTLGQQIFDWLADNPLAIGIMQECPAPIIYNKNMRNMPKAKAPIGWDSYGLSTYHPEAFFYDGGKRA